MITILQYPQKVIPAYNEHIFVVESDNYLQSGFKFVFDIVFIGNAGYTRRIKKNIYPGTTNKCVFDPHRIIENYLTYDIDLATDAITTNDNSWKGYLVRFGEEYGGTVYPNLAESDIILAFNASLDFATMSFYQSLFVQLGFSNSHFLTQAPTIQYVNTDDKGWLYFTQYHEGGSCDYVEVNTYDSAGSTIQTIQINNPYATPAASGDCFLRVPSHPASLNLIDNSELLTGAQPIIDSNVASYDVRAWRGGFLGSKLMQYRIRENCSEHQKYRLYFLNPKGGFDTFSFTLASKQESEIRKEFYKKPRGGFNNSGLFVLSLSERLTTQYYTEEKVSFTLTSDWLTDAESTWLNDLLTSPVVFLDVSNNLLAVTVTDKKYEVKKALTDQVFNLTITIEPSYTKQYQRQ